MVFLGYSGFFDNQQIVAIWSKYGRKVVINKNLTFYFQVMEDC